MLRSRSDCGDDAAFAYRALRRFDHAGRMYERALAILSHNQFVQTERAQLPLSAQADFKPGQAELRRILSDAPTAASGMANGLFFCALAQRDPEGVHRAQEAIRPEGLRDNSLWRAWLVGLAARATEEKAVHHQPDYAPPGAGLAD